MWTQGRVISRRDWNDKLFSLTIEAKIAPFIAGQFIKLSMTEEGKRIARAYSIVSAPSDDVIEVLAVRVEEGQLSPQLHSLNANDVIEVSTKAAGFMILDELAQDSCYQHLWFLATGTGVGPFISMMRTQAPWDKYQKVILAYGVRHVSDLAYLDTLEKLEQTYPNQFVFIPLVTRESYSRGLDCRIPEGIASGRLEALAQLNLTPNNTQVMICGNPDMVAEAQKLLDEKGLVKHLRRAPGHVTVEKYW